MWFCTRLCVCLCGFVLVYVFVSQDLQSKLRLQPPGINSLRIAARAICNKDISEEPQHTGGQSKNPRGLCGLLSGPSRDTDGGGRGSKSEDAGQACLRDFRALLTNADQSPTTWMSWSYRPQEIISFGIAARLPKFPSGLLKYPSIYHLSDNNRNLASHANTGCYRTASRLNNPSAGKETKKYTRIQSALNQLHTTVSKHQRTHPDGHHSG